MTVTVSKCRFPHDLNYANQQINAELAKRTIANQALLQTAIDTTAGLGDLLDEGNKILDSFFTANDATPSQRPTSDRATLVSPNNVPTVDNQPSSSYNTSSSLTSSADIATVYGLLPDNSTEEQDEKFITNAGIILFDTVVYLPGAQSGNPVYYDNIEILRRLYFSLGENITQTKQILDNNTKTTFVLDQLNLQVIPPKQYNLAYTLDEINTLLNVDYLTGSDVVVAHDFSSIVLTTSFLATDKSKAEVLRTSSIAPEELVSNVFHFNSIDNSTSAIARYTFLGYTGDELGAILAGQDIEINNQAAITTNITATTTAATQLIDYINFIVSKYYKLSLQYRKLAFSQISSGIANLIKMQKQTISSSLFQVSVVLQPGVLDQLELIHTDAKIEYLLEKRQDVLDVWFTPPDDEFLKTLSRTMDAAPVGSTYISNQAINNAATSGISQQQLLLMYADMYDAQTVASNIDANGILTIPQLNQIVQYLGNLSARTPLVQTVPPQQILQGQPSAATPASVLIGWADIPKTMDFDTKKKAVTDSFKDLADMYPSSISGPLSEIITNVMNLFEKAMRAINIMIGQAQKKLLAMKKKLDSFISRHLSLIGNSSFSTSLLKCAVNWDIGLSTDILDQLFNFFLSFVGQLLAFLYALKTWIADLLNSILCMPVDLLNNFLGQVQIALPSACKIPKLSLGTKLTAALNGLKNVSTAQTFILQTFGKDIAKLRVEVRASPDKINQFKTSAGCASTAGANFMNASMLNVGVGVHL